MLLKKIVILSLFALYSAVSFAENFSGEVELANVTLGDVNVSGGGEFKRVKADSVNIAGHLELSDLNIIYGLNVSGSASGKVLKCSDLTVSGSLEVEEAKIKGNSVIWGSMEAKNSVFKDIKAAGEVTLKDSKAANILFEDDKSKDPSKLFLKGKTVISGDIYFKSGDGEVYVDDAVVISGNIKGARIIKK